VNSKAVFVAEEKQNQAISYDLVSTIVAYTAEQDYRKLRSFLCQRKKKNTEKRE
jgi:hypothetical protein